MRELVNETSRKEEESGRPPVPDVPSDSSTRRASLPLPIVVGNRLHHHRLWFLSTERFLPVALGGSFLPAEAF